MTEGKREKPLGLDMDFAEAWERFAGVDRAELPDNIRLGKKPQPKLKGDGEPPPSKIDRKSRDPDR